MEILIAVFPLILLVLFVFAIMLMFIALGRFAGYLIKENTESRSQLDSMLGAFKFIVVTDISGRLSYLKVFITSVFVSLLIVLCMVLFKLMGG
ncbi:MAG: hypothetical protein K6L80_12110 [Agarilytica sp.]